MRQYPIWNEVTACIYKSNKSYGAVDTSETSVLVGSGRSNSHNLVKTITTKRFEDHEVHGNICVFRFSVDGVVIKDLVFKAKNEKVKELLENVSLLEGD